MKIEEGEEVGECENCGIVTGDDVALNFPNQPECNNCGEPLERATIAQQDRKITQTHD